jgi:hypothetical protein
MLGCAMLPFRREKLVRYFANDRLHDASSLSQFELQDPPRSSLLESLAAYQGRRLDSLYPQRRLTKERSGSFAASRPPR